MDIYAERKHRHELKRKAKRAQVRLEKAHAKGNRGERGGIGEYGSRSRHHRQGNMPVEVVASTPAPTTLTKAEAETIRIETAGDVK